MVNDRSKQNKFAQEIGFPLTVILEYSVSAKLTDTGYVVKFVLVGPM